MLGLGLVPQSSLYVENSLELRPSETGLHNHLHHTMENRKFVLVFVGAGLLFCLFLGLGLGLGHHATKNNIDNKTHGNWNFHRKFISNNYSNIKTAPQGFKKKLKPFDTQVILNTGNLKILVRKAV